MHDYPSSGNMKVDGASRRTHYADSLVLSADNACRTGREHNAKVCRHGAPGRLQRMADDQIRIGARIQWRHHGARELFYRAWNSSAALTLDRVATLPPSNLDIAQKNIVRQTENL